MAEPEGQSTSCSFICAAPGTDATPTAPTTDGAYRAPALQTLFARVQIRGADPTAYRCLLVGRLLGILNACAWPFLDRLPEGLDAGRYAVSVVVVFRLICAVVGIGVAQDEVPPGRQRPACFKRELESPFFACLGEIVVREPP